MVSKGIGTDLGGQLYPTTERRNRSGHIGGCPARFLYKMNPISQSHTPIGTDHIDQGFTNA
jgi:hypothetical protein